MHALKTQCIRIKFMQQPKLWGNPENANLDKTIQKNQNVTRRALHALRSAVRLELVSCHLEHDIGLRILWTTSHFRDALERQETEPRRRRSARLVPKYGSGDAEPPIHIPRDPHRAQPTEKTIDRVVTSLSARCNDGDDAGERRAN